MFQGLDKPRYIEDGPMPLSFTFDLEPQFYIYVVEPKGNDILLYYLVDDGGFSIYADDEETYNLIPQKIKVISGGWYGKHGRWRPMERHPGTLLCKDVKSYNQLSKTGKDHTFKVTKKFFSRYRTLIIENEMVGKVEIVCKKIIPQDYEVMLFSKDDNGWKNRSELLKELNFNG